MNNISYGFSFAEKLNTFYGNRHNSRNDFFRIHELFVFALIYLVCFFFFLVLFPLLLFYNNVFWRASIILEGKCVLCTRGIITWFRTGLCRSRELSGRIFTTWFMKFAYCLHCRYYLQIHVSLLLWRDSKVNIPFRCYSLLSLIVCSYI